MYDASIETPKTPVKPQNNMQTPTNQVYLTLGSPANRGVVSAIRIPRKIDAQQSPALDAMRNRGKQRDKKGSAVEYKD